jgi:hypothetical protein
MRQTGRRLLPTSVMNVRTTVQLYIANGEICTRVSFPNFVSLYAPKTPVGCVYKVTAFTADGVRVDEVKVPVDPYGSAEVDLAELFGDRLSIYGMFAATMALRPFYSYCGNHLGLLTPHYLTLYKSQDMRSMALIHCLSKLNDEAVPHFHWRATVPIDTGKLAALEIYQVNPGSAPVSSELFLEDLEGKRVVAERAVISPRATRRLCWPRDRFAARRYVRFGALGLTAVNAKPLVFMRFLDGTLTGQHP